MIDCGVHALQNGRVATILHHFAAGDADDAETLLENFRSAALECVCLFRPSKMLKLGLWE